MTSVEADIDEVDRLLEEITERTHCSEEKLETRIFPLLDEIVWLQRRIIRAFEAELRDHRARLNQLEQSG